jgi:hypothetical protein
MQLIRVVYPIKVLIYEPTWLEWRVRRFRHGNKISRKATEMSMNMSVIATYVDNALLHLDTEARRRGFDIVPECREHTTHVFAVTVSGASGRRVRVGLSDARTAAYMDPCMTIDRDVGRGTTWTDIAARTPWILSHLEGPRAEGKWTGQRVEVFFTAARTINGRSVTSVTGTFYDGPGGFVVVCGITEAAGQNCSQDEVVAREAHGKRETLWFPIADVDRIAPC